MFNKLKLGSKYFLSLIIISIIPLIIISLFIFFYSKARIEKNTIDTLHAINNSRAKHINHIVQLRQEQAKLLSGTYVARQLNRSMLGQAELILVMEQNQIEAITKMAPEARGKIMLLGRWNNNAEIPDPYKKSTDAFAYAIKLIEQGVASWLKYLK